MDKILNLLEKLFNSLRYNLFYILLSLLFPIIIYKFDAGAEIIRSMAEGSFRFNLPLSFLAFAALSFSIWCVPTLAIRFFRFVTDYPKGKVQNETALNTCLFNQLILIYNGTDGKKDLPVTKNGHEHSDATPATLLLHPSCNNNQADDRRQIPARYFAIAPWFLFIATCLNVIFPKFSWLYISLIVILLIVIHFLTLPLNRFWEKIFSGVRKSPIKNYMITAVITLVVFTALSALVIDRVRSYDLLKWIFIIAHILGILLFYSFARFFEAGVIKSKELAYRISDINYKILLGYLVINLFLYYFLNQYQLIWNISAVVVIITMSTFLIIFFELFFTSQLLLSQVVTMKRCKCSDCKIIICPEQSGKEEEQSDFKIKTYRYALYVLILMVINFYLFSSCNSHRIRKDAAQDGKYLSDTSRLSLYKYFDLWLSRANLQPDSNGYINVRLVSGQGGGSRAAAWFFMNMVNRDIADPDFFKSVFAMSTVSGSSSGANMYLTAKANGIDFSQRKDSIPIAVRLYGRDYMSAAFYGMMLGDAIEGFFDKGKAFPRDRNYHLQKEELAAYENVFGKNAARGFENDYLYLFDSVSKEKTQPSANSHMLPLFLINTAIVDFGTRGIFSPVPLKDFSFGRDLYMEFKKDNCNANYNLPMVACVNQSQAFPILSAYNYMECVGRFVDGGLYENSGCATTLEVYNALRKYCDGTGRANVRFNCINLLNGQIAEDTNAPFKNASILNSLTAIVNTPFGGHMTFAFKNLTRQVNYWDSVGNKRDFVETVLLDDSITLTRTMSRYSVEHMYTKLKK